MWYWSYINFDWSVYYSSISFLPFCFLIKRESKLCALYVNLFEKWAGLETTWFDEFISCSLMLDSEYTESLAICADNNCWLRPYLAFLFDCADILSFPSMNEAMLKYPCLVGLQGDNILDWLFDWLTVLKIGAVSIRMLTWSEL